MNLPDLTGLRVATARVSYSGPGRLDITRKGEDTIGLAFAPSWDILTPALAARKRAAKIIERARKVPELVKVALLEAAEISRRAWEDYVPRYAGELDASMTLERPDAWAWLARRRDLRDWDTGQGLDDAVDEHGRHNGPMSHAWLLCCWLNTGVWPGAEPAPPPRQITMFGVR